MTTMLNKTFVNALTGKPFTIVQEEKYFVLALDEDADPTDMLLPSYYIIFLPKQTVEAATKAYIPAAQMLRVYNEQYDWMQNPPVDVQEEAAVH